MALSYVRSGCFRGFEGSGGGMHRPDVNDALRTGPDREARKPSNAIFQAQRTLPLDKGYALPSSIFSASMTE